MQIGKGIHVTAQCLILAIYLDVFGCIIGGKEFGFELLEGEVGGLELLLLTGEGNFGFKLGVNLDDLVGLAVHDNIYNLISYNKY